MKKWISIFAIIGSVSALTSCSQENPVLLQDPDVFAMAVNHFDEMDMGNHIVNTCGDYYAHPDQVKKAFYSSEDEIELQKSCAISLQHLADYLNKKPEFKSITIVDLQKQSTWLHYFQSKRAHGGGLEGR